mgnify:CR=1 FL=1|jgi:NitT/TauT family transport system permease protein
MSGAAQEKNNDIATEAVNSGPLKRLNSGVVSGPDLISNEKSGGVTSGSIKSNAMAATISMASSHRVQAIGVGILSLGFGILMWHFATLYNFNYFINFENVPSPLTVGGAFISHLGDAEFYKHILVSMRRILFAYCLAVLLGVTVGLLVGRSRLARAAVLPYIEVIRPIPAVAWIPLAILMWPTEESSIVYITFLGALFPIILNTIHGVEETPEVLVRAALSLGAKKFEVFWHVVLPAALPSIAAGLSIGMGISWFSLLAGEIISGQYGIGYFTWDAYSMINYPDIVVGMLIIGGLGTLSTYLIGVLMRPALRWKNFQR